MRKCVLSVAVLAVLAAAGAVHAGLISTTVVTDADAYVDSGSATTKYGGSSNLEVRRTGAVRKPYLHFDLTGLDPALEVQGARLKMTLGWRNSNYGQTLKVCAIMAEAEDWDLGALGESDITWNTAPKVGDTWSFQDEGTATSSKVLRLGTVAVGIQYGAEYDMDFDVTPLIQWALEQNAAYSNYTEDDQKLTFCLMQASDIYAYYRSKEYTSGDDTDAPRLEITQIDPPPVAEPAGLGLIGLALIGLKRKRS
jgi:hypothetical protein